jgi:Zn-dependent peptidase ImmA (M78 family)
LVYGAHPPELCKIHKQKKYFSEVRGRHITFDVVIELYREGRSSPHLIVVFECKNQSQAIQERDINDFSKKLGWISEHGAKGVVVVSSRLQSGAEQVVKNSKMGIVKYNEHGFEITADRKGGACAENRFVESQMFKNVGPVKSLKFSAYDDGKFFSSIDKFLGSFDSSRSVDSEFPINSVEVSVPYVRVEVIRDSAQKLLEQIDYQGGSVELKKICPMLSIDLLFTNQAAQDGDGNLILGSANFDRKSILINSHDDKNRERFTIAHEIGHFCLKHDKYLRSEYILERDLLIGEMKENSFNYERLEFQANTFASDLLLPNDMFVRKTAEYREYLDIKDRGHGYIFVDDQPCNYGPYNQLLSNLSSEFEVSKQAIEIKFKKTGTLTDQRNRPESLTIPPIMSERGR